MSDSSPYLLLRLDDPDVVIKVLRIRGLLSRGENVTSVTRAGEGNMNLVLRVQTDDRSFIVKQSRPWVEKYPSIAAPEDRILVEIDFYRAIADRPQLADGMPALIGFEPDLRLAVFVDLGDVIDYTSIYASPPDDPARLEALASWLSTLHSESFPESLREPLSNRSMRELNHAHLFEIPLTDENGLDLDALTPGLGVAAARLKADSGYVAAIRDLGAAYLADGTVLLHGDYYPGSWVRTESGPRIIDPEFCFFGPAEYDAGVMAAHLVMADCEPTMLERILGAYGRPAGFDPAFADRFAGMEIMRRLIGVAQLPLDRTLTWKMAMLDLSRALVHGESRVFAA